VLLRLRVVDKFLSRYVCKSCCVKEACSLATYYLNVYSSAYSGLKESLRHNLSSQPNLILSTVLVVNRFVVSFFIPDVSMEWYEYLSGLIAVAYQSRQVWELPFAFVLRIFCVSLNVRSWYRFFEPAQKRLCGGKGINRCFAWRS